MPGNPEVGTSHKQEVATGIAEGASVIVALGEPFIVPAGTFSDTVEATDIDSLVEAPNESATPRSWAIVDEVWCSLHSPDNEPCLS